MTRMRSLLAVAAVMTGCWTAAPAEAQTPAPTTGDAVVKPVPTELPAVVARVNGEAIDGADLQAAVAQLESRAGRTVPPEQRDRVFRGVLDQLIAYRLLSQESVTRNIQVPEADVEARVSEIQGQFPSAEVFQQTLTQQNMTAEQFREDVRKGLRIVGLVEAEVARTASVTPEQVEQFYAGNAGSFQQGERVRASHILIAVPQNADAAAKEQARAKAEEILKEAKAGGDFAELAKLHSQDPGSAPRGGDLDYFERGQMVGPFEETAFALAPGQVSEIIETQFGFHIIKLTDKQAARTVPLDEVRAKIEEYLKDQNRERQTQVFIEALRSKAQIDILM